MMVKKIKHDYIIVGGGRERGIKGRVVVCLA